MIFREATVWRWSHIRHHSDTLIVGRDPEIAAQRPADVFGLLLNVFAIKTSIVTSKKIALHCTGRLTADERTFVPEVEHHKIYTVARLYVAIFGVVAFACLWFDTILPAMLIGLPTLYGGGFVLFFGLTQHAGLAENVLDHRLNTRTVYMNPIFRFLYWNMNYHLEHHMFPMVMFHALAQLHEETKAYCPPPYLSCWEAYREILPALARQVTDPTHCVLRKTPADAASSSTNLRSI